MRLVLALLLALPLLAPAQSPRRPKLVVAIVVDQFRYDYLTRFRDQYTGGLARLLNQGAVFTNAFYQHYPTVTAIGHSTLLSGATPSISGIVGNDWYDRGTRSGVTSVEEHDKNISMLGGRGKAGKSASPRRLLVSTLGDELKMAGRNSKVIGISMKDRSAILPAGHMADGAFWFDETSGNFVTSTYYAKEMPAWASAFNKGRFTEKFIGQEWKPVGGGDTFKKMSPQADDAYYKALESTPYGNEIVEKFAEAALTGEQLGKRNTTDVLAVSFSSNDYVGHSVGPDSPQVRDISIRTDRALADLFRALETHVGMKNVLVVFTADHGVAPVPEVNQQRKMPGGRMADTSAAIQKKLTERFGEGKWLVGKTGSSHYLNLDLIRSKSLNENLVAETAATAARSVPHVFRVYTKEQLRRGAVGNDLVDRAILNGFHHDRSADITIVNDPYYLEGKSGTSHGLPFSYDTHVPVIFLGDWVKPGRYHNRIAPNDIAPTLATILDVETPSGAIGHALDEIIRPVAATAAPVAKKQ